ncbi:hypothetical protein KUCAC02_034146, partial [Chaenocephalus aceratus]
FDSTTDPPGIYRGRLSLPTCKMDTTDPEIHHEGPDPPGPGPSCVSMKSDWSMPRPIMFKDGEHSDGPRFDSTTDPPGIYRGPFSLPACKMDFTDPKIHHEGPDPPGPGPSCVSMKSDRSMPLPITFKDGEHSDGPRFDTTTDPPGIYRGPLSLPTCKMDTTDPKIHHERPDPPGPGPSCVSMKSDWSMPRFTDFKDGEHADSPEIHRERPDSPGSSSDSMESESTRPPSFEDGEHSDGPRVYQQRSEGPGGQSAQQLQAHLESIFMLLEDHIITFVKNELKKIQTVLTSDYPEFLESQSEDEEVLDGEDEEQRSSEAFLNISLHFLRSMKQEELAERLQS